MSISTNTFSILQLKVIKSLIKSFWDSNGGGGGGGTGTTNLTYVASPTNGTVTSDTGTDATLTLVNSTNAGLMSPGQKDKLDGLSSGDGVYLPLAGGTMTGGIAWNELSDTALINIISDPLSSTGEVFTVESDAGIQVKGPYVVLDTTNLQITMPGAQQDAAITVAGIDAFGVVSLGYTALPPPSYSVIDTTAIPVVIKAAGAIPPTAWVSLGLSVTLGQDLAAGAGNISFEGIFSNPTNRTGTVEFGLRVNGGTVNAREIITQIAANFYQTIAMTLPMVSAFNSGDVLELMARVTQNNNNAFSLAMDNSATDLGAMKVFTTSGSGSGGGGSTNLGYIASPTNGVVTSDTGGDATLPLVNATNAGLMSPAQNTKLAGIATGATANQTDAYLLSRTNHTGTQASTTISDFASASRAQTEAELLAGTNITITPAGTGATRTLTIAAAGGGGGGTVTSVGATAPVTTTGGTAPVIGMPAATVSVDGYLSAANFTTFSNKVDNVTASAPVAVFESPAGTINVSMPVANGNVSGYLSSANWNTFNSKANAATTIAGYGITDAYTKTEVDNSLATKQPLDADLTAIAGLAGTSGFLKKTAANTWSLDTSNYSLVGHTHVIADVTGLQTALDSKQGDLTLTTTGTSGAATLVGDTLNIPNYAVGGGGTVTDVTATAPVQSTGGATPNLSMPAATVAVNGYLTSANFTIFNNKAPTVSPAFTGTPTAPTASVGTNTTQLATTAFVNAEIANDAPTKTGGGASGSWGISITGSSASATVATTIDNANSASNLTLWTGTEAQYTAIGTKDPNTLYFRTA